MTAGDGANASTKAAYWGVKPRPRTRADFPQHVAVNRAAEHVAHKGAILPGQLLEEQEQLKGEGQEDHVPVGVEAPALDEGQDAVVGKHRAPHAADGGLVRRRRKTEVEPQILGAPQ